MKTSIYISDSEIRAVTGAPSGKGLKIRQFCAEPIPEGLVRNGLVADPEGLSQVLRDFLSHNSVDTKNMQLVLDCETVLTQILTVPNMSEKKLLSLIGNEFVSLSSGYGELLYDYSVILPDAPGGGSVILACALEKDIVRRYMDMFKDMGDSLWGMDIGLACAIRLCRSLPELSGKTCSVSLLDGRSMISLLFVDGIYNFSTRVLLSEERGTPASAVEISRNLSSLLQFNSSQNPGKAITHGYLCGMSGDEEGFCADISSLLDIDVGPLPDSLSLKCAGGDSPRCSDYLYCLGDLLGKK